MKKAKLLRKVFWKLTWIIILAPRIVFGQFFNQDFNLSTTIGDYVSAAPNIRQFNHSALTGTATITANSNRLNLARGGTVGSTASLTRSTDIAGIGSGANAYIVRFTINQNTGSSATNKVSAHFQLGTGFTDGSTAESGLNLFGEFYIHNSSVNNQMRLSPDGTSVSISFATNNRITVVMNRSGSTVTYMSPATTGSPIVTTTVATGKMDIWVGNTLVSDEADVAGLASVVTDFKIIFAPDINTTLSIDDISMFPAGNFPTSSAFTIGKGVSVATSTSTFTSLTRNGGGIFEVLNYTSSINGANTFSVNQDIDNEDGTNPLYQLSGMSAANLIKFVPQDNTERLISGSVNSNGGMIRFNNADHIEIDGNIGGSKYLRFRNTNSGTGANNSTLVLQNGATNIKIKNCFIETSGTGASGANGGAIKITADTFNVNRDIEIKSCHIRNNSSTTNTAGTAILIDGTEKKPNRSILIEDNDIYNFFVTGDGNQNTLNINRYSKQITIKENHFYQTLNYTSGTSSTRAMLLRVQGSGNDSIYIQSNYFGGRERFCGGSYMVYEQGTKDQPISFRGAIRIDGSPYTEITNNTIKNIHTIIRKDGNCNEHSMHALHVLGGVSKVTGNTIGSTTDNTSLLFSQAEARTMFCSGGNACSEYAIMELMAFTGIGSGSVIEDNVLAGVTCRVDQTQNFPVFNAVIMRLSPSNNGLEVKNNLIGSTTQANNIRIIHNGGTSGSTNLLRAVSLEGGQKITFENNHIVNITNFSKNSTMPNIDCNSNPPVASLYRSFNIGINQSGTGNNIIRNNLVENLTGYAAIEPTLDEATVIGIRIASNTADVLVSQNTIHSLLSNATGASAGTTAAGILVTGGAQGRIEKSAIYNIRNLSGGTTPAAAGIVARNIGQSMIMTNNMISLGLNPDGTDNTEDAMYLGMWNNFDGSNNCYFIYNSVAIGGSSDGSKNSYGFLRGDNAGGSITTPAYVINNLFYNARTRVGSGTGKHFAIGNQVTCQGWGSGACSAPTPPCVPSVGGEHLPNYNAFYASQANELAEWLGTAQNLTTYQGVSDDLSITVPNTMSFTNRVIADLHVQNTDFQINAAALPLTDFALDDYDGEFRRGPDRGADEVENTLTFVGLSTNSVIDWNDPANWSPPIVPTCSDNVIIPSPFTVRVTTSYPSGRSAAQCYKLIIQNGASIEFQDGAILEQCWFNGTTAAQAPYTISPFVTHEGIVNISGGTLDLGQGTVKVAGRFDHSATFNKGTGTVQMNFDTPSGNTCFSDFSKSYNETIPTSDIGGTATSTNFHNLTILNNGQTSILTNKTVLVGDVTNDNGQLDIQGSGWLNINGHELRLEGTLVENTGTISGKGPDNTTTSKLVVNGKGNLIGTIKFTDGDNDELQELTTNRETDGSTKGLSILANTIKVNNTLNLTKGRLQTGAATSPPYTKLIHLTNSSVSGLSGGGSLGYVWGTLRRNVSLTGNYSFPVGHSDRPEQMDIDITANVNLTQLTAFFNPNDAGGTVTTADDIHITLPLTGYTYGFPCDGGFWDLTPTPNSPNVVYGIELFPVGIDCPGALQRTIGKRATSADPFTFTGTVRVSETKRVGYISFSEITQIYSTIPLPLTLTSFEAVALEKSVLLNWLTEGEYNFSHFVVERKTGNNNFTPIGTVKSKAGGKYNFEDKTPALGVNYYRLRMIDNDGKENFSKVVWAEFKSQLSEQMILFPNPTRGKIALACSVSDTFKARLISALGG